MELKEIEELAVILKENAISEITVERQGSRILLRRGAAPIVQAAPQSVPHTPEPDPASPPVGDAASETPPSVVLVSRMVGVFHHDKPAVRVGTTVQEGQVIGHVEQLKLMIEVTADVSGLVAEVFIDDGAPVEYGLRLFRITPA